MYLLWVFLKKGFWITFSYPISFALNMFSIFLNVAQMGYLAVFIGSGNRLPVLDVYGGSLLAYLISGTVFMSFVSVALTSFQQTIRSEQQMGTLPYLLCSRFPILGALLFSSLWTLIWTVLTSAFLLVVTVYVFGTSFSVNLVGAGLALTLTVLCLSGIGLASAGVIIVTKQGDPITWMFTTLAGFASGVVFPVDVLPTWLQAVSRLLPTTYALTALRKALLVGTNIGQLWPEIRTLLIISLVTLPIGTLIFLWGYRRSRVDDLWANTNPVLASRKLPKSPSLNRCSHLAFFAQTRT